MLMTRKRFEKEIDGRQKIQDVKFKEILDETLAEQRETLGEQHRESIDRVLAKQKETLQEHYNKELENVVDRTLYEESQYHRFPNGSPSSYDVESDYTFVDVMEAGDSKKNGILIEQIQNAKDHFRRHSAI